MDFSWTNICMRKIVLFIFAMFSFLVHFDAEAQEAQEQRGKQRHFDREAFEASIFPKNLVFPASPPLKGT